LAAQPAEVLGKAWQASKLAAASYSACESCSSLLSKYLLTLKPETYA
jgi:hypothetical protein